MTVPTLSVSSSLPSALEADVLVVGVRQGTDGAVVTSGDDAVSGPCRASTCAPSA